MKSSATAQKTKTAAATASKETPTRFKRPSKKSAGSVPAPATGAAAKPARLLLERFPNPDKERVCLGLYAPGAEAVFVAGTFNDWQPSSMPLQREGDGRWAAELRIEPGRHEYRFIVDGRWTDDPLSPAYAPNPFGGLNGVLVVGLPA